VVERPHPGQKAAPIRKGVPHAEHAASGCVAVAVEAVGLETAEPQCEQKAASSARPVLHEEHCVMVSSLFLNSLLRFLDDVDAHGGSP
jgi:hypothetical protein